MQVEISQPAEHDIAQIGFFIATDDKQRGISFMKELRQACLQLAEHPLRAPVLLTRNNVEIRKLIVGNYLVLYQIRQNRIAVLRILHGARDIEALILQ
tara:strand:+ start:1902 stop:2195 length:294 start_codon:yes stop_codon:yes gene_type:complete